MAVEEISPEDIYLPSDRKTASSPPVEFFIPQEGVSLEDIEKKAILQALEKCLWVQKDAARLLKISPRTLNYKISKHNIGYDGWKKNL